MPRFFVLPEKVQENHIVIDTLDVAHIRKVLRLKEGDQIEVCDTCGYDYQAQIESADQSQVVCKIISKRKTDSEPDVQVTLYQGIPKGTKMDYIIQKTTELGVTKIVPCLMLRCVVKLENKKAEEKKVERWRKIAEEAAKQSGRGIIPEITMPMSLDAALEEMKQNDLAFVPYECERETVLKYVLQKNKKAKRISFMIGPEGGFDPAECLKITRAQLPLITLGKRILRTETAGEAVLSMVMYEFEQE